VAARGSLSSGVASRYDLEAEDLTPEALPAPWPGRRTRTRDLAGPRDAAAPSVAPAASVERAPLAQGSSLDAVAGARARFADRADDAGVPATIEVRPSYDGVPTWADRIRLARWQASLESAALLRPDLVESTAAYRHFLLGLGAPRAIDYERYVATDPAGDALLAAAVEDALLALRERMDDGSRWWLRSEVIAIGGGNPRYPFPRREDWQKALGAHALVIDVDAEITDDVVTASSSYLAVTVTLHAESAYIFVGAGEDEDDNDALVRAGLAHPFVHRGTCTRRLVLALGDDLAVG
jgi:hypothetical protein